MRLVHVITALDQGGAEGFLSQLAPALAARGVAQRVVAMVAGGVYARHLREAGIEVVELGMRRGVPDPRAVLRLASLVRAFRPQVVQGWLYHANLLSACALGLPGGQPRPKLAWGIRSAEMDVRHYGMGLRVAVAASAMLSGRPDAVIANSEAGMRDHVRLGFKARRWVVIPNGIDLQRFRPDHAARDAVRAELGLSRGMPLVGIFARNDPIKNLPALLAALDGLTEAHVLVAGLGTETLPEGARRHLLGVRADVPRLMAACDVTVLGSLSEGFPNVVAESLACGVPVVSTDAGDARTIIASHGRCVPQGEMGELVSAARALLAMPAAERERLGAAARADMQARYSLDAAVSRFADFYRALASERLPQ